VLGGENRYLIGDLLQKVAHKEKQPFLDFIAELGLHQKNRRHWWASNIAYRSPLASDLFLLWCYAAVFDKVCSQKKADGEKSFLVFVEERWLYRHLWQRYKENGSSFSFLSRKSVMPELLKSIVKGIAIRGYSLIRVGRQIWHTKDTFSKDKAPNLANDKENIYIYSWVRDRFFKKNGRFESPYFGRLPQFMSSNGLTVVYIAPLFLSPSLKSKCLNYGEFKFIFLDQYLTIWSVVRSFFSFFSISSFSLSSLRILLLREIANEFSSFPNNILEYYAFKGCLKEIKQKKITIIYPFENQPWEKMLCLAAKELDKNIRLIGYQHATVPLLMLNYFLGTGESSNMPLPHLIVTNGEYTLNLLKNAGYGETEFINGGALRYEHLHKVGGDLTKRGKEPKTILVALPYSASLAQEMLLVIFNAFKDLEEEKVRFMIKFHPEVPLESLKIQLPAWPAHFERTDKSVPEILKEVDVVIYSSGTIGLEALLGRVPVIRYCSEHIIDLDPLDGVGEEVVRSCSENNFKQVVLSALSEGGSYLIRKTALSVYSVNRFFSPVDGEVWRQIVKS